jgi:hypothetical protein
MKFYRGPFADLSVGAVPVKLLPNSYFIDIDSASQPLPVIKDYKFLWINSGIIIAIQLAMYMGYSRIVLNGVDFEDAGNYSTGETCDDIERQQNWYNGLAESVKSIAATAKQWGFQFYSTRENRLNLPPHTELLTRA